MSENLPDKQHLCVKGANRLWQVWEMGRWVGVCGVGQAHLLFFMWFTPQCDTLKENSGQPSWYHTLCTIRIKIRKSFIAKMIVDFRSLHYLHCFECVHLQVVMTVRKMVIHWQIELGTESWVNLVLRSAGMMVLKPELKSTNRILTYVPGLSRMSIYHFNCFKYLYFSCKIKSFIYFAPLPALSGSFFAHIFWKIW